MTPDQGQQAISGISRRSVLRGGLLAGAGMAAMGAASAVLTGTAQAAAPNPQSGWGYCIYCSVMWWTPGVQHQDCVGSPDYRHHYGSGNHNYSIYNGPGYGTNTNPQGNWTYCPDCQALFWGQSGGVCAGNVNEFLGGYNPHAVGSSTNYNLDFGLAGTYPQPYWRWCIQCHVLFWSGPNSRNGGACPAPYDNSNDYGYHVGGGTNYDAWWYTNF